MSTDAITPEAGEAGNEPDSGPTAEQRRNARLIIAGLFSGRRPGHQPMTDAEFLSRYDPERYEHGQLIKRLDRLTEAIEAMAWESQQPTLWTPQAPPVQQKRGTEL